MYEVESDIEEEPRMLTLKTLLEALTYCCHAVVSLQRTWHSHLNLFRLAHPYS